jgi:hypothetical protein
MNKITLLCMVVILLTASFASAADKVVVIPLGGKKPTGDAVATDVLTGKTFSNDAGVGLIGTAPPARVAETGITKCYEADGFTFGEIPCAGTGQDGDWLNGTAIPVPRFTDNNNGTVTDNLTGLVWLQDASCYLNRPWASALGLANNLSDDDSVFECGLSDGSNKGDWRLPSLNELQSLINYAYINPAISNAAGTGRHDNPGDPFFNIQLEDYWSSTTYPGNSISAWFVNFDGGAIEIASKNSLLFYVWPVRDQQ